MRLLLVVVKLVSIFNNFASAQSQNSSPALGKGCSLIVPEAAKKHFEPLDEHIHLNVHIEQLSIRDVPTSGGSYSVQFLYG